MVKIHKILTGLALWGIISAGAVLCPVWAGAKTEKYTNTDFAMNTVAVSYTHLDVYKRQPFTSLFFMIFPPN